MKQTATLPAVRRALQVILMVLQAAAQMNKDDSLYANLKKQRVVLTGR